MEDSSGITSSILIFYCISLFIILIIFSASLKIVPENKRLQVYRLGRDIGEKGPGIVLLIPIIDKGIFVDVLNQMKNLQNQVSYSGVLGETITLVHTSGKVLVNNETIFATSKEPIAAGEKVRIIKVIVEVEKIFQN